MMKKLIALVIAMALICCAASSPAETETPAAKTVHQIEQKMIDVYIGSIEACFDMPFYFMDGVTDLPWIDLESASGLISGLASSWYGDTGYSLDYTADGETIALIRENDFSITFDFAENSISCLDYNMFLHNSSNSSALDALSLTGFNEAGEPELFQRNENTTFDRLGDDVVFNLSDYGIEMVFQDGMGFVPLQTLGDLILTPQFLMNTFYNGKAVFLAKAESFGNEYDGYTPLGEYYYSAEPCERSDALAEFGYNELCFALDCMYGLKEIHEIESFDNLFWRLGYRGYLHDRDASVADSALAAFISFYLDDLHSTYRGRSWMNAVKEDTGFKGTMYAKYEQHLYEYTYARYMIMGEEIPCYMEVGNTAYITIDDFEIKANGSDYYTGLETGEMPNDTISAIITAHRNIYRENSPIENVVIDLSCNGGGHVDAALFLMGWVLGEAPLCVKDTFTGALSTATYRADTNLDRVFDEKDTLKDKKVYCLISPLSFSGGNLVPAVFKYSQRVTLLGRTSGGGSCMILPMSTAWGTAFQISSKNRMSFFKNGSFYDIDQGVDPDIYLSNIDSFFNREKLTEYINNMI